MATLLKIDVSPRGGHSISRKLGNQFAEEWKKAHSDGKVVTRDLATTPLPFVDLPWIMGAYSDPNGHTEEQKTALKIGNEMILELEQADHMLITTPMYNFAVPAALKAWIDHVVRVGKTFNTTADGGYVGLLKNKKATVAIASAGIYTLESGAQSYNAEQPYVRQILGFIGITDVTFIEAGSTWKVDKGMASAEDLLAPMHEEVTTAATK